MAGGYTFPPEDAPDSPWPIFERVLDYPELEVQAGLVREHEVLFAFALRFDHTDRGWTRGERRVLGTAQMPRVSGALSDMFDQLLRDTLGYEPDFLILLNGDWWEGANDKEREILVVHELLHCGQALDEYGAPKFRRSDNAPILAMIAHDVEEFVSVARRYGAWKSDIADFWQALEEHRAPGNGGPRDGFDDFVEALDEVIAEVNATPPPLTDADLPPDVDTVDPDLRPINLSRDNQSQDESTPDLF